MLQSHSQFTTGPRLTQQSISTLFVNHLAPGCQNWYKTQTMSMKNENIDTQN